MGCRLRASPSASPQILHPFLTPAGSAGRRAPRQTGVRRREGLRARRHSKSIASRTSGRRGPYGSCPPSRHRTRHHRGSRSQVEIQRLGNTQATPIEQQQNREIARGHPGRFIGSRGCGNGGHQVFGFLSEPMPWAQSAADVARAPRQWPHCDPGLPGQDNERTYAPMTTPAPSRSGRNLRQHALRARLESHRSSVETSTETVTVSPQCSGQKVEERDNITQIGFNGMLGSAALGP